MCVYRPRAQITSIFEGQPSKTRPFSIKTMVIWVLGAYIFIYLYFPGSLILRSQFLQVVLLNLLEEIAHLKELSVGMPLYQVKLQKDDSSLRPDEICDHGSRLYPGSSHLQLFLQGTIILPKISRCLVALVNDILMAINRGKLKKMFAITHDEASPK